MAEIRVPIKSSSIEKKNKIIDAGLDIFKQKGYYNTNTAEIAKHAGVSTGIVYQYFKDKKDILMYAVKKYFDEFTANFEKLLDSTEQFDLDVTLKNIVEYTIKEHKDDSVAHEEIMAMSHLDHDVMNLFIECEHNILDKLHAFLLSKNLKTNNMYEKIHIAYNLIESLSHEIVYHKHDFIDYDSMINETMKIIKFLFLN